jgi:hypothetical protein
MTAECSDSEAPSAGPDTLLDPELVWDEYKYRHDLCWRLVFQITAAVVTLNVIPYIEEHVAAELDYWILALPAIGLALALIGRERLRREQDILDRVRCRHRGLHYPELYGADFSPGEGSLQRHTDWFLFALAILAVLNMLMIAWRWLPAVE